MSFQILPNQLRWFFRYDELLIRRSLAAISLHDHDAIGQRSEEWRHGVVDLTSILKESTERASIASICSVARIFANSAPIPAPALPAISNAAARAIATDGGNDRH